MNQWEQKIRLKESKLHTDRQTKSGTKKPDLLGYELEDVMLSDFMVWAFNTHTDPQLRRCVFHIENEGTFGGKFGAMQGAISKGKGKRKGVLDVESVYLGLDCWLEFKLLNGGFEKEQLDFISDLISWNKDVYIIRCFDFFKFVFEEIIMKGTRLGGGVWTTIEQVKNQLTFLNSSVIFL